MIRIVMKASAQPNTYHENLWVTVQQYMKKTEASSCYIRNAMGEYEDNWAKNKNL